MFADIDADIYVLVDGDSTYDAASAPRMIERLRGQQLDMVTAVRTPESSAAYRLGHRSGNRVLTKLVSDLFHSPLADMLSGYRVFSRRFVKSFPALITGFEIETALTVHALELRMPMAEIETPYKDRARGSTSKLRTYPDGFRILQTILRLVLEVRPLALLGWLAFLFALTAVAISIPVFETYAETGLVPRLPTAVLSASMMVLTFLLAASGIVLDMVTLGRREAKRLRYLALPGPANET
jgi:hypothetical protein